MLGFQYENLLCNCISWIPKMLTNVRAFSSQSVFFLAGYLKTYNILKSHKTCFMAVLHFCMFLRNPVRKEKLLELQIAIERNINGHKIFCNWEYFNLKGQSF